MPHNSNEDEKRIKRALSFCKASGFLAEAQLAAVARGIGEEVVKASPRTGTAEGMAAARRLVEQLCAALRQEANEGLLEELVRGEVHPSMALLALPSDSMSNINMSPAPLARASSDQGDRSGEIIPGPPDLHRSHSAPSPGDGELQRSSSFDLSPDCSFGREAQAIKQYETMYEPDEMEQDWLEQQLEQPDDSEQKWLDRQLDQEEHTRQQEFDEFWSWQVQQDEIQDMEKDMEVEFALHRQTRGTGTVINAAQQKPS